MKAVILVGGRATRLQPLTASRPKALMPVLNTPFLAHVIHHLKKHQIAEIILALGHLAEPVESRLGDGSEFGVKLTYVVEDTPRGTAGGIKKAERYLDGTFLALNGDIFTDLDITTMVEFHREKKALATIALTRVDDPSSYGLIETDRDGRVVLFHEKPRPGEASGNMINAGTYVLEPGVLARVPPEVQISIEREVFPGLLAQRAPVYAFPSTAYWLDIGTPENYLQLHYDLLAGKCLHYVPDTGEEAVIGQDSNVHPSTKMVGPVVIGANCFIGHTVRLVGPLVIGDGCNIQEDSSLEGSIVWDATWIGPRVTVKNSVVADHCYLEANSVIDGAVLGDHVTVCIDGRVEPGSRVDAGTTVEAKL